MRVYHYVTRDQLLHDGHLKAQDIERAIGDGRLKVVLQLNVYTPQEKALANKAGMIEWFNGAELHQHFGLEMYSHLI